MTKTTKQPETSEYQKQATDFLQSSNTSFNASYKTHGLYFPDDKMSRDIWYITLKNSQHRYRFTFGQSINNAGKAPTEYDVLACLTKYEPGTFENFCGDFGYDTDSRTAERTYKAVCKEWENIEKLFSESELEQLREIN
jgi:hypothetical protein